MPYRHHGIRVLIVRLRHLCRHIFYRHPLPLCLRSLSAYLCAPCDRNTISHNRLAIVRPRDSFNQCTAVAGGLGVRGLSSAFNLWGNWNRTIGRPRPNTFSESAVSYRRIIQVVVLWHHLTIVCRW